MTKQSDIQLKNLTKKYESPDGKGTFLAVDHINVNISGGQFVTLLGPSGCGKTTTLRMIAGFESITDGEILLDGKRINEMTPDKRDSSMVFQSYALFPHYDVFGNVAYGLVNKKMDKKLIKEKVLAMLELVGLKGLEYRFPNQLSGGQQQRVALARALVMEPAMLLFDEPLSNLDAKLRVYMRKEIRKIQQRIGITSIYVTHDQSEAMSLSDLIIIMNKGHIEQCGTPREIYHYPKTRFVADFIGSANFMPATVKNVQGENLEVDVLGSTFTVHCSADDAKVGDKVDIVIRPESIELADSGDIEGEVVSSTYMGALQEYVVRVGDHTLEAEAYNPIGKKIYEAGDKVWLKIHRESLHAVNK